MPKTTKVLVSTVDTDLEFTVLSSTTGKQLFDKVVRALGVREAWYFGLLHDSQSEEPFWLDLTKKLSNQGIKKQETVKLKFLAKYFPEDASEELILPLTKHLFFLQVQQSIISDDVYTPPETSVLLASLALQAKHGDFKPDLHTPAFFAQEGLIPNRVIKQHALSKAEWDEKVLAWYKEHKGMEKEAAMQEYLKVAQDLDMYGVTFFSISNKKGSPLWLGVDALGLNVYEKNDKLTPKIGFPWAEVKKVSYSGKKFIVKSTDSNSPSFIFLASKSDVNKRIICLSKGNYEMYSRRRKADSIEVQQMKAQVKEETEFREAQKLLLIKEQEHRSQVENQNKALEDQLEEYRRKVEMSHHDLQKTQQTSEELRVKLEELEAKKKELEESEKEAYEAKKAAEKAVSCVVAEKLLKEEQAREAQALLEVKIREASEKEEEARSLQEELEKTRNGISSQDIQGGRILGEDIPNMDITKEDTSRDETLLNYEIDGRKLKNESSDVTIDKRITGDVTTTHTAFKDVTTTHTAFKDVTTTQAGTIEDVTACKHVGEDGVTNHHVVESPFYSKPQYVHVGEGGGSSRNSTAEAESFDNREVIQLDQATDNQKYADVSALPDQESHEFQHTFANLKENERLTEAESNIKMGNQLKTLRQELEVLRDEGEMTSNDQIYVKNVKQGRDKYKTLKQIRQGNTKIRIETFESL